ncbi:MAG: hypothetical protein EA416_13915 [Trueperaceae bacterium]|nr:MAG: hypothetical protein EA416_13915 [Trueperaceae bacterium]
MEPMSYTTPELGRRYVDVVASLSAYGEAPERLGREMLLSNYSGVEPTLTDLNAIADALAEVSDAAERLGGHPGDYMRAITRGSRAVLGILEGDERPYLDVVRDIIEIDLEPIPDTEAARLRETIFDGLGELGYHGSLEERVTAWRDGTSLTGDDVIAFARTIMDDARNATLSRVVALPEGEGLDDVYGVRDVFYSGRSKYTGDYRGWVHFNIDKHWQRDVFVQVLTHEAYPGHQTFYALWDQLFRQGKWPIEAAFYQRNAPTNPIFEGGPESALHFLGWDEGDSPEALALRLGQAYKDLGRIAMQNGCLGVNTGQMTKEQAIDLMVEHLVPRDDAERAYGFFTNAVSRTHYPQYYYGRRIVQQAFARFEDSEAGRQRFFDMIYRTPHTTRTFIAAVAEASGAPFDPFRFD